MPNAVNLSAAPRDTDVHGPHQAVAQILGATTMSQFIVRGRKALTLLVSATVLAGSLAVSSGASAKPIVFPKPFPGAIYKPGFGYGAAALAGGLALGAIAASAASAEDECYIVRRRMIDEDGNEYIRRVRVCD